MVKKKKKELGGLPTDLKNLKVVSDNHQTIFQDKVYTYILNSGGNLIKLGI